MTAEQIRSVSVLFLLSVCTRQDLKDACVFLPIPVGWTAAAVVWTWVFQDFSVLLMLSGILIGLGMVIMSGPSRGEIGSGDGWVLCACGACLGLWRTLILLMTALLFSMVLSAVLLLTKKKKRYDAIPFIPFLLAAFLCMTAAGG